MINGILSPENIKALAEMERSMDNGKQPFVRDHAGRRWAMPKQVLEMSGCVSGQTVSDVVMTSLLEANVAYIQMQIVLEETGK